MFPAGEVSYGDAMTSRPRDVASAEPKLEYVGDEPYGDRATTWRSGAASAARRKPMSAWPYITVPSETVGRASGSEPVYAYVVPSIRTSLKSCGRYAAAEPEPDPVPVVENERAEPPEPAMYAATVYRWPAVTCTHEIGT